MPENGFAKRHRQRLSEIPVAYFVVCLTMAEDTPENRKQTLGYLDPLRNAAPEVQPLSIGLFGGAVLDDTEEYKRLFILFRKIIDPVARDTEDARDWEAIRTWAEEVRPVLLMD